MSKNTPSQPKLSKKSSFKPKAVTKRLLQSIPERPREVVVLRYGLGESAEPLTLESIGKTYGITRERVRQIENHAISLIRRSEQVAKERETFLALADMVHDLGAVVSEEDLLGELGDDEATRNHVYFLLVIGDEFTREKEDDAFRHRWNVNEKVSDTVHKALRSIAKGLDADELVPEEEMVDRLLALVNALDAKYRTTDSAGRWLRLSKELGKNPLNEWGKATSPNVRTKGIRDLAYLAIKRHGSPMHFSEVARAIEKLFSREAHVATTHNELIKDKRFVLVGRGLYALKEWGYEPGIVKSVIEEVLREHGPLSRDEVVKFVLKERYVKPNTIAVNLQDSVLFRKNADGTYILAK